MEHQQTAKETFLEIMREEMKSPELSFEKAIELPLAKALYATLSRGIASSEPRPVARKLALSDFVESEGAIEAAIQDTYLLEEIKTNDEESEVMLACSDVVMLNSNRRLRLTDAARAEFLATARNTRLYQQVLKDAVQADRADFDAIGNDPIRLTSAWLRSFLANDYGSLNPASAPLRELTAARTARERLRLVDFLDPSVPSIVDLDRRVALGELLEPLRLLIGAKGGWEGIPRTDRFVGRDEEIRNLRAFVDELSSQSVLESINRIGAKVAGAIGIASKSNLRIVQGDGGLGKSALLAKFILDHALDQKRPFPFAYLDFDRATLDPQSPQLLLIEIARQIGLQFPDAQPHLSALSQDIRNYRSHGSRSEPVAGSIADPYSQFTEVLRKYVTFGERTFLLVMDTMEVVQWNPSALSGLATMLSEFRSKGLAELRVVVSGRADVPELRQAAGISTPEDNIQLLPLSVAEATSMAEKLGQAALGSDWQPSWSKAIVGGAPTGSFFQTIKRALSPREDIRREPLTVRVAVDLVLQAEQANREKIVADIQSMSDDGQYSLAGRLYEKRIVNHVRDPKAKKLAWPGLVLRRVTLRIASEMLAPLCGLAPEDIDDAFESLSKEVWMVVREGDILRHRPDLRARTLPLMRANNPETFDKVARAAVVYFGRSAATSDDDCAEWIYHRLQVGERVRTVASDVRPPILAKLASAEQDFAVDSEASSYLASRTATRRLSPTRIGKLAPNDALYHLSETSQVVFSLDDSSIDRVAIDVSHRLGNGPEPVVPGLYPWAEALWVKTGAWRKILPDPQRRKNFSAQLWRMHLYWVARLSPTLPRELSEEVLNDYLDAASQNPKQEGFGLRATIQAMSLARVIQSPAFVGLDQRAARMLTERNQLPSMQAALRTAIILGDSAREPALDSWIRGRRRGSHSRLQTLTFSATELRELASLEPNISNLTEARVKRDTRFLRYSDERMVAPAMSSLEQFLSRPLGNAGKWGRALAGVFACRDEDWIIPFGYAAQRAIGGRYVESLRDRVDGYFESKQNRRDSTERLWTDMLGAIRIADEAGDLAEFAKFVAELSISDSSDADDLVALLEYHGNWTRTIKGLLGNDDELITRDEDSRGENPPAAGPIFDKEDLQRGRWGGRSERDGRLLRAVLESVENNVFYFSLIVESTDNSVLEAPVVFHLHDTFPKSVIRIRRIIGEKQAQLSDWNATGVFTVGAQVKDRNRSWISLELDLATLPGLPERFLDR